MTKEEKHAELLSAAITKLEEAAELLTTAEEAVFADQANELADMVDVIATPISEISPS